VDTAVFAAIISGSVALAGAEVTYLLTKKRDREAEWRSLKLNYYRELVAAMSGIVGRRSTPQNHVRFADALNNLNLVAPKEVITKLYAFLAAILRFLGYDPRPEPETLGGRIRAAREAEGLSEEALARQLGLDPGTVAAWERDEVRRPYPRSRRIFERWLASVD
jgi:helix-turn-helix protein